MAHGFKTSYNDFANHIIENILTPTIKNSSSYEYNGSLIKDEFIYELDNNITFNKNGNFIQRIHHYKKNNEESGISNTLKEYTHDIQHIITNSFLGKLFDNKYDNWFDIEDAYFSEIIVIERDSRDLISKKKKIEALNNDLIEIKQHLFEYLKTIRTIDDRYIRTFFNLKQFYSFDNLYIINFNYTITLENYFDSSEVIRINYIHGDIESEDIIFGYGNDKHPKYNLIKESGVNEYLRFFKTFEYLNNKQYSEVYDQALERFDDYDVSIIGHSLSQTDKTLLKEILDNEKCKRIHLYKRKDLAKTPNKVKEEFNNLIYSISRIIDNERDLRVKVLNFDDSLFFP